MFSNKSLFLGLFICTSSSVFALDASKQDQSETRGIMAQIFSNLAEVLPLSLDTNEFSDPKNREKITGHLRKVKDSTNALVEHTKRFEGSYGFIAKSMARDFQDIHKWFEKGSLSESRYLLQQVTENCVSCHLKLPDPGHAPKMDQFFTNINVSKLSKPELARLQIALRQFDDAVKTFEDIFNTWPKPNELFAMDILPEYLKIMIRVKFDPKRALVTLENLSKRSDLPKFMTREMDTWKVSLGKISKDAAASSKNLQRAKKIIQDARSAMEYPMDRTRFIDFLVASGILNRFLQNKSINTEQTSEAYYLLGITESLIGRSTWLSQTDYYLEASVRAAPQSKHAVKAFDALEQQILMEFSGSGGTNIPDDIQANLEELRGLVRRK